MDNTTKPTVDLNKQYGIVSRFFFKENELDHFEQIELEAGNGVIFYSNRNDHERFTEKERDIVLAEAVKREDFQSFAIISKQIHGLYLSDGQHHIGVGTDGKSGSGIVPTQGDVKYGLVWGPTFEDVSAKLEQMKKETGK